MAQHSNIARLAAGLRRGDLDPVELGREAIDRANDTSNVFIHIPLSVDDEANRSRVRHRRGDARGPLDGIPVAWKDLFDMAGVRTTAGSACLVNAPAAGADSAAVAALRAAGVLSIGKTNLSEFAFSGLGLNPHFGTPTIDRPGVATRAPGGSSSGSAVAVRDGIVPVALGTDTAGSVRVPAAFNGVIGYKSSTRRYDMTGVFPLATTFDSIGPLARSVADCVAVDGALRGAQHLTTGAELTGLTFVIDTDILADSTVTEIVRANLLATMDALGGLGATVTQRSIPSIPETRRWLDELGWAGAAEGYRFHAERLAGPDRDLIDPSILARLELGRSMTDDRYQRLLQIRREMQARVIDELAGAILVTPTVGHVAPELAPLEADPDVFAQVNIATLRLTMIGSFLDMPGLAMPSGVDHQDLATSVQFSLPSGDDERLLRAGLAIDAALS